MPQSATLTLRSKRLSADRLPRLHHPVHERPAQEQGTGLRRIGEFAGSQHEPPRHRIDQQHEAPLGLRKDLEKGVEDAREDVIDRDARPDRPIQPERCAKHGLVGRGTLRPLEHLHLGDDHGARVVVGVLLEDHLGRAEDPLGRKRRIG
ncbi:MAG: hypothetical protein EBR28_02895 [Planctomycetia bacterium]|nr:hypothetical protein [Planctomycetia bacterium]